jgi:undecaprenyl-diphosphatase
MVLISVIQSLKSIDTALLLWINSRHNDSLDAIMWNASDRFTWLPLYAIMAFFIIRRYGKASWLPIVFTVLAVVISDQCASHLLKNLVMRYRPSHNLFLQDKLHYVNNYLGGLYGFASSHAANSMAFAVFMLLMFRKSYIAILLFFYVALVCYSRVYIGVHYPSDIAGGLVVGTISGLITYNAYTFIEKRYMPQANKAN